MKKYELRNTLSVCPKKCKQNILREANLYVIYTFFKGGGSVKEIDEKVAEYLGLTSHDISAHIDRSGNRETWFKYNSRWARTQLSKGKNGEAPLIVRSKHNSWKPRIDKGKMKNLSSEHWGFINTFGKKEGALKKKLTEHFVRESNPFIKAAAKELFRLRNAGQLKCEICNFNFNSTYGIDYVEAHHKIPLNRGSRVTKIDDFIMLCANCHRVVHSKPNRLISCEQLKRMLKERWKKQ